MGGVTVRVVGDVMVTDVVGVVVIGVVVVVVLSGARYQPPPPRPPEPRPAETASTAFPVLVTRRPRTSPRRPTPSPATVIPAGGTITETRPSVTTRPTSGQPRCDAASTADAAIGPLCRHRSSTGRAEAGADVVAATSAPPVRTAALARSRRVVMVRSCPGSGWSNQPGARREQDEVVAVHD